MGVVPQCMKCWVIEDLKIKIQHYLRFLRTFNSDSVENLAFTFKFLILNLPIQLQSKSSLIQNEAIVWVFEAYVTLQFFYQTSSRMNDAIRRLSIHESNYRNFFQSNHLSIVSALIGASRLTNTSFKELNPFWMFIIIY